MSLYLVCLLHKTNHHGSLQPVLQTFSNSQLYIANSMFGWMTQHIGIVCTIPSLHFVALSNVVSHPPWFGPAPFNPQQCVSVIV